jgi:hypothetical protein
MYRIMDVNSKCLALHAPPVGGCGRLSPSCWHAETGSRQHRGPAGKRFGDLLGRPEVLGTGQKPVPVRLATAVDSLLDVRQQILCIWHLLENHRGGMGPGTRACRPRRLHQTSGGSREQRCFNRVVLPDSCGRSERRPETARQPCAGRVAGQAVCRNRAYTGYLLQLCIPSIIAKQWLRGLAATRSQSRGGPPDANPVNRPALL